jgi:hypothetical protein
MSNENPDSGKLQAQGVVSPGKDANSGADGQASRQMKEVKSAWDKAPEGTKKANALQHYQSAEKAIKAGNEPEAIRELEKATRALS